MEPVEIVLLPNGMPPGIGANMRTLFLWENCHMFDGQRAYWVEVPLEVFRSDIQGSVPGSVPIGQLGRVFTKG
jgi:hypothetical protein